MALRWTLSLALLSVGGLYTFLNVHFIIQSRIYREHISLAPIIGGLAAAAGMLLIPVESMRGWWWVPLFLDIVCVPLLGAFLGDLIWRGLREGPTK